MRPGLRSMVAVIAVLLGIVVAVILAHFAIIEIGREVATLRVKQPDGSWRQTRLWIVDYDGSPWLHSAGKDWEQQFEKKAHVQLVRDGRTIEYLAKPDRNAHEAIDGALRQKYGLADRWVRFLAPCDDSVLPVRLSPVDADIQDEAASVSFSFVTGGGSRHKTDTADQAVRVRFRQLEDLRLGR